MVKIRVKKAGDRIPNDSIFYKAEDPHPASVEQVTQAAQGLSAAAGGAEDSLQDALNVTGSARQAAGEVKTVTRQIAAADAAGAELSGTMGKLIQTGGAAMAANTAGDLAGAYFGSAHGDTAGTIASGTASAALTGAAIGGAIFPTPLGFAAGAAIGGLLGALGGAIQTYEKQDEAYKDWYQGLYEHAGSETDRMLTAGRSAVQETLGQPEAELNALQGTLDAAGGEGYSQRGTYG